MCQLNKDTNKCYYFHRSKPKENWDIFEELPPDKDSDLDEDRTVYNFVLRALKVLASNYSK